MCLKLYQRLPKSSCFPKAPVFQHVVSGAVLVFTFIASTEVHSPHGDLSEV